MLSRSRLDGPWDTTTGNSCAISGRHGAPAPPHVGVVRRADHAQYLKWRNSVAQSAKEVRFSTSRAPMASVPFIVRFRHLRPGQCARRHAEQGLRRASAVLCDMQVRVAAAVPHYRRCGIAVRVPALCHASCLCGARGANARKLVEVAPSRTRGRY